MSEAKVVDLLAPQWDALVDSSEQGTIFCKTAWLKMYGVPYQLLGVEKNGNLLGGICGWLENGNTFISGAMPLTPFQGVLVANSEGKYVTQMSRHIEVAETLLTHLNPEHYPYIKIMNHFTFPDIRPFLWTNHFRPEVKYTYVLPLLYTDEYSLREMDKDTRNLTRKCVPVKDASMDAFADLYHTTFDRKGLDQPVTREFLGKVYEAVKPNIRVLMSEHAGVVMMWDNRRAYYILGASDGEGESTSVLWQAMQALPGHLQELDFVGCNSKQIGAFKKGFGGTLRPYFGVTTR